MKVLLISHTCQSRSEGQPKAVELARLGHDVTVVVPRRWKHYGKWRTPEKPDADAGFRFLPLTARWPWCGPAQSYLHWYPRLGPLLRDWKPDVIDLWEEPWSLVSAHTCWLRDQICPDTPIVSETEQNIDKFLPPPFESFRSFVLRHTDFVVGRNAEAVEIVRRKEFRGPTRVVPNAVDAEVFRPLSRGEREAQRAALRWAENEFVCGYVGRLVEEKGLSDLVEAVAKCRPQTRAVVVGNGPFEAALRAQIGALSLEKRVELLPARGRADLALLMGALDALILPSRTTASWKEQFGRVLIEAQACGVPVIGSSSGAIPDVVGEAGLIFPEGDAGQLAACLDFLATNPEQAQTMGRRGQEIVEQKYTWRRVAESMAQIYAQMEA